MNIHEACERVLGKSLADAIAADKGMQWCALAAMVECKASHGPEVKAAISTYFADLKQQHAAAQANATLSAVTEVLRRQT